MHELRSQLEATRSSNKGLGAVDETAVGNAQGSDPQQQQQQQRSVSVEARAAPTGVVLGPSGAGQWREVGKKVEEHEKTISVLQEEIHK